MLSANKNTYKDPKSIQISDYTYHLPDERIAKFPLKNRDESKLLVYKGGEIQEEKFSYLPQHIDPGTIMVFNNTKVIQARLIFYKETGARIEIFCLEPVDPSDYSLAFQARENSTWKCIVGNLRKWKSGVLKMKFYVEQEEHYLSAERVGDVDDASGIRFEWNCAHLSFSEVLELAGKIPIPPYLNRDTEDSDLVRYQTVYSRYEGSVAAPTAGLHFTPKVFDAFEKRGVLREELTLHVGAGTFKPVKAESIGGHDMHTEHIQVTARALEGIGERACDVIAVGTTSVRTLESLYWMGVKIMEKIPNPHLLEQWEAYQLPGHYSVKDSFAAVRRYMRDEGIALFNAATQIIIAPGYEFKVIKGMVTNFHQPQSTLLLLISALIGDEWRKIYQYALDNDFRFLSYGDSSLLMRV